jgi:hypothetical protein
MKGPARLLLASTVLIATASTSWGQPTIQPTPVPTVSAENETWYRAGEPLSFAGNLYYPAGAALHFLPNEMVRSGFYRGIPFYSRTTIEPFSMIFVPAGRGLMQPYERRRDGELAGTKGSTAPAISPDLAPSVSPTTAASSLGAPSPAMTQAAAPPFVTAPVIADEPLPLAVAAAAPTPASLTATAPQPVGSSGRAAINPPRRPIRVRPGAANAAYVEFDNARWLNAGPPVSMDTRSLTRVGESHGFPVYAARPGSSTIYIPLAQGSDALGVYKRKEKIPHP